MESRGSRDSRRDRLEIAGDNKTILSRANWTLVEGCYGLLHAREYKMYKSKDAFDG